MIKILISFLCLTSVTLFAEILETPSHFEVLKVLQKAGKHSLVVYDLDETLVYPEESAFQRPTIEKHRKAIKPLIKPLSQDQKELFASLALIRSSSKLIDKQLPKYFNELRRRGVRCLGLTASLGMELNGISFGEIRHERLQELGIGFQKNFPELGQFELHGFSGFMGRAPLFDKGILFANSKEIDKGELLLAFLKAINFRPNLIVFIDDRKENVERVEAVMKAEGIPFIGIHFTGIKILPLPLLEDSNEMLKVWMNHSNNTVTLYQKLREEQKKSQ